jgi:hypothetical protein
MQINDFLDKSKFKELKRQIYLKENNKSIEELLYQPYFEEANKILVKEMEINAGYNLLSKMKKVFVEEKKVLSWFYTPSIALKNQRPYDYCKIGKRQGVYDEVVRIEHGVLS